MNGRDEIGDWIADALGASLDEVAPLGAAGLSREMWAVTGKLEDGSRLDGVVKRDTGRGPLSGSVFTPGREAAALIAVAPSLMERLAGESDIGPGPQLSAETARTHGARTAATRQPCRQCGGPAHGGHPGLRRAPRERPRRGSRQRDRVPPEL